ncbi:MAG: IclR family transcriptional regulator C-terminal domain-containing protein [Woeseiaceae bacterium]
MMMNDQVTSEKDYLKTLAKGLQLIKSFDGVPPMTLSEVAKANDLSRAAARRHLHTLRHLGYVSQIGDRFQLTPKILDIGHSYLSSLSFAEVLSPLMNDLSHTLKRPCSAAILDGFEIVYVQHVGRSEFISINVTVGSRLPAYATSIGQILLGGLSDEELEEFLRKGSFPKLTPFTITDKKRLRDAVHKARKDGYALVDQQFELGLRAVAVPIRDHKGKVVCGLAVSRFNEDISPEESTAKYLPALLETAAKIDSVIASFKREWRPEHHTRPIVGTG